MTCDDAFDALTDPVLCKGDALRRHLASCPRCRQMQDVLQPALALFAPAETSDGADATGGESYESDASAPFLTPEALAEAENAARVLRRRETSARRPSPQPSAWLGTAVAAVLFIGLAGLGIATLATNAVQPRDDAAVACLWQKRGSNTSPAGRTVTPRQVVLSCINCHGDAALE